MVVVVLQLALVAVPPLQLARVVVVGGGCGDTTRLIKAYGDEKK